ncbi:unnamed protein product [Angiostrongylus costaricensis]|uniref:DH domain-containing protein n=1 Tax=Angiostrongylus costaricensis TaxID=334426 RepID=A0A0R3PXT8_ANGCS|nr:unnamed protein product [Angiostrongylus costaricensis]
MEGIGASENDSDLEMETEAPRLDQLLGLDVMQHLEPKERNRQEAIKKLFHSERTHVRNLKVLSGVFHKPMSWNNVASSDVRELLFANVDEVIEIHMGMLRQMRQVVEKWERDPSVTGVYGNVGELLENMFDGEAGEKLMQVTTIFCENQEHALEVLRTRLQLKDHLPVEMQRLVKYPLLLEAIAKYTDVENEEYDHLLRTVESTKRILRAVNTAKENAENVRRLEETAVGHNPVR